MARYLAVGNLNPKDSIVSTAAMRIFFGNPEVEFLHTGPSKEALMEERRAKRDALRYAQNGNYDLVIAGDNAFPYPNPRKSWFKNMRKLITEVLRHPNLLMGVQFPYSSVGSRLAAIDMEDRPLVNNRWLGILDSCICFFKRELPQNLGNAFLYVTPKTEDHWSIFRSDKIRGWLKKFRPISLGVAPEIVREYSTLSSPKKTDVFFAGDVEFRPSRGGALEHLEGLRKEGFSIDVVRETISREEFFRRCAQAYIVWSPEGFGWDCFRHYEAAVAGSVPLMPMPTIRRYAPFVEGEHAHYYCVEGNGLVCRVREALRDRQNLFRMGLAARQHVLQWHTYEALGRYVIAETKRTMGENSSVQQ